MQSTPKTNLKVLNDVHVKDLYSINVRKKFDTLRDEVQEKGNSTYNMFDLLKYAIESDNSEILPKTQRKSQSPWVTNEILEMMDVRRTYKGRDEQNYSSLNRLIQKECLIVKSIWVNTVCEEIEILDKQNKQLMYTKFKEINGKRMCNSYKKVRFYSSNGSRKR